MKMLKIIDLTIYIAFNFSGVHMFKTLELSVVELEKFKDGDLSENKMRFRLNKAKIRRNII